MILILTASIMYWSLQQNVAESDSTPTDDIESSDTSNLSIDDVAASPQFSKQANSSQLENEGLKD